MKMSVLDLIALAALFAAMMIVASCDPHLKPNREIPLNQTSVVDGKGV